MTSIQTETEFPVLKKPITHTHTYSQIQYLSTDSWVWNKSVSISDNTHTCKSQETTNTTETHYTKI